MPILWSNIKGWFAEAPTDEATPNYSTGEHSAKGSGNPPDTSSLDESTENENEEAQTLGSVVDSALRKDSETREHLLSPEKIPGQVRRALVRTILMRAKVAAILNDWKRMERHGIHAQEQAYDLHDGPIFALCFFTLGIAYYNQREWPIASEAFVLALPCVDIYKLSGELDEWFDKTHKAMGPLKTPWTGPLSTARLRNMSVFSVPNSGYPKTSTGQWQSLAGLVSAGQISPRSLSSTRGSTPMRNSFSHVGSLSEQTSRTAPSPKGWQNYVKFQRPPSEDSEIKKRVSPSNKVSSSKPMPSSPKISLPEDTVASSQGLDTSLPEDTIHDSNSSDAEERGISRTRAFSPGPAIIFTRSPMPRGRSPLYDPSPSPSPPRIRESLPLSSSEENQDSSEQPPPRVHSRLNEVHSSRNPSTASHHDELHLKPEQSIYITQTNSPGSAEEIDGQGHSDKVERHGTWFDSPEITEKQWAAIKTKKKKEEKEKDHHGENYDEDDDDKGAHYKDGEEEDDNDKNNYDVKDQDEDDGDHDSSGSRTQHKKWIGSASGTSLTEVDIESEE